MKRIIFYSLVLGSFSFLASCGSSSSSSSSPVNSDSATVGEKLDAAADSAKAMAKDAVNPNPDENFVKDVVKANADEMVMLQAGIDKGTSKELKAHAKMMLADHQKVDADLKAYAGKKNIMLASDAPAPEDMTEKQGKDWDKAWVDKMVDGHQKTISKFEGAQNDVKDEELKSWIMKTLPTLRGSPGYGKRTAE